MRLKDVFVQNLRKYRRRRKISQAALADICDTSTSYIGQIEIGNRFPSLDMVDKIAKALQIKPHLLFAIETDELITETMPLGKGERLSDGIKDELIVRLTAAIHMVVRQA